MLCNNISFSYKYLTITFFTAFDCLKKKKFSKRVAEKCVYIIKYKTCVVLFGKVVSGVSLDF